MLVVTLRTGLLWVACFVLASSAHAVRAQDGGTCATGSAEGTLETATLTASLFTTGSLFFGGSRTSGDGYVIPKRDGVSPVFAASFWVGGKVGGELRVAGARFGNYVFRPGPLEDAASPSADCTTYDRIYKVSRQDVARYLATGRVTDDLRDWPVEAGAPVVDGDGVEGNYNLAGGDQPEVPGDVNAFWVMNDVGRLRDSTRTSQNWTAPVGVEVRVLAYAFDPTTPNVLSTPTFYRYDVVNRGTLAIDSLYAGMWVDPDLGGAGDDYTGSDTLRNMVYVYNSDEEDAAYGEAPPSWGVQMLGGPVGLANGRDDDFDGTVDEPDEALRMTAAPIMYKSFPAGTIGTPIVPEHYFNVLKGRFSGGLRMREFGLGGNTDGLPVDGPVTAFGFSGDPVTRSFWSEMNQDNQGTPATFGDRRMMLSTGPIRLGPGESATYAYAMPYGQGSDHLQSIEALRQQADVLSRVYDGGGFVFRPVEASEYQGNETALPQRPLELSRVNPNPSAPGEASAVLYLPTEAHASARIYDALGRALETLVDDVLPEGETVLAMPDELAPGTYLLRVRVATGGEKTLTFTVAQ